MLLPPGHVLVCQDLAGRRGQVETLDDTVQAVLGHTCTCSAGASVVICLERRQRKEMSMQFTHVHRWHPDFRDDVSEEQSEKTLDIFSVGLDASFGNLADIVSIGNQGLADQGSDDVVDVPD